MPTRPDADVETVYSAQAMLDALRTASDELARIQELLQDAIDAAADSASVIKLLRAQLEQARRRPT